MNITEFIHNLPKAEIHVHLEGATEPETVLELAQRHKMLDRLPSTQLEDIRQWFVFRDFPHFLEIYLTIQDLIRTPEDFALLTYKCAEKMAAQNIRYREVTFTPYTHTNYLDKGLGIKDILGGLEAGRVQAREEFGVEMRWVFDVPRNLGFDKSGNYKPECAERTLEYAIEGKEQGVVGFGLGGFEVGAPPEPFAHAFKEAKEAGLLSIPHAGETEGSASVRGAIEALDADRIGHGVRAIEDPELLLLLKERQIPLEINPTSNICLHVYGSLAEHPFPHLDRMGLFVTVNTDDPPLFNATLNGEFEVLADVFGYEPIDLARIARNAFVAAGIEDGVKHRLLSEFDEQSTELLGQLEKSDQ